MSANSADPESRKPRPSRTSIANRDKPLFAGRRPPSHLQQRQDFFTDSLNTSYAPSPSPTKKTVRPSTGANPRATPVKGKQPATASRATPDGKKENKSLLSSPSTNARRQQPYSRRPPAIQPSVRGSPSPAPVNALPSRSVTRTPSPARGEPQLDALSPASDASASSPPRGLAEAYQRIEDEEYLASREDDSVDDPDYMGGSRSEKAEYVYQDQQQGQWGAGLLPSRKSSRRTSLREAFQEVTDQEARHMSHEDRPQSSDGDSTDFLTPNAEHDTFDQVLTQYDKDEQRLRGALVSDGQPFKKSRIRDRAGLTTEDLHREEASSRSGSSTHRSPSISSKGSDPSFNIPQGWGRKGRGNNTWLSRISQESGKFTGDKSNLRALRSTGSPAQDGKELSSQVVDWIAAAAEVPLPTVENESLQTESTSRRSTPASHLKRQPASASSDRIRRWEFLDDDFTARSLQASDSPPIRLRNGALDAIREREIESLEKSAVTTNRLGELKEKKSVEWVRRRSPSVTTNTTIEETRAEAGSESGRRLSTTASLHPPSEVEEAEAHQQEPASQEKSLEPSLDMLDPAYEKTTTPTKEAKPDLGVPSLRRPSPERHDSRDLLRKLARATSASPGPGASPTGQESAGEIQANERPATSDKLEKATGEASPTKMCGSDDHDARNLELTADSGRRPLPRTRALVESTPQPKKPNVYLRTPVVTGAWIDTPLPIGGRGLPMPTPEAVEDDDEPSFDNEAVMVKLDSEGVVTESSLITRPERPSRPPLAETAPLLPKSALAAIIEKAKSNAKRQVHESSEPSDDTLLLDDSTIQSLEELLVGDRDNDSSVLLTPPRSSSPLSPPSSEQKPPLPHATTVTTREQEVQSYDNLTSRLSKVGLSISDAKKGIASLERAVSTTPSKPSSALVLDEECTEAGEFHDFIWPCERCGCRGRDDSIEWQSLRISMPRLWTWRKEDWMPRLTPVGAISTIIWALLIANWIVEYVDLSHP